MITIKCIYGREMFETWHKMLAMLQSGLDVRGVITHRFPAGDFGVGFDLMNRGRMREGGARLERGAGMSKRVRRIVRIMG